MITMHNVTPHGRWVWDRALFPDDEQQQRIRAVQAAMAERGLDMLIVIGNSRAHADLHYLTQFSPLEGFAYALVPAAGDSSLVANFGAAANRAYGKIVKVPNDGSLRELMGNSRKVGIAGFDDVQAFLADRSLAGIEGLEPADDMMAGVRSSLRAREITALREAARIVKEAAKAMVAAYDGGASNSRALVAAEGVARRLGALDFRSLYNRAPAGELMPMEGADDVRTPALAAYLAVEYLGYWADLGLTVGAVDRDLLARAQAGLQAMRQQVRAGAAAADIASAAVTSLGSEQAPVAVRYGLGNAVGLHPQLAPYIEPASQGLLAKNMALSLRVQLVTTASRVLVSDLLLVGDQGGESLLG